MTLAWNAVEAAVPYQAAADIVIIRWSDPDQIRTEGKLIADGGSARATAPRHRLDSVVRKVEVFASTGQSLRWAAVSNSIT